MPCAPRGEGLVGGAAPAEAEDAEQSFATLDTVPKELAGKVAVGMLGVILVVVAAVGAMSRRPRCLKRRAKASESNVSSADKSLNPSLNVHCSMPSHTNSPGLLAAAPPPNFFLPAS